MRAHTERHALRRRLTALTAGLALVLGGALAAPAVATAAPAAPTVRAAATAHTATINGVTFDPGYIISDPLFYDRNAMTQPQIQAFLARMVGKCSTSSCLNLLYSTTSDRPADRTICTAYKTDSDRRELASMIIFKVQQACGISAKVLLVTLQKEQGLITDKAPESGELKIAMGYACPDTAACNTKYYGFFNQIYSAAWQLKRYSTPDKWGNYQPGTETIKYHPKASCGSKKVYIRNNATAALYNYTPYTPNAAALAKLGQATPPCGSYGNRNFWDYYNSWFGSSIGGSPVDAINGMYLMLDGAKATVLGAPGPQPTCTVKSPSCMRTYEHGVIYWTYKKGPVAVVGVIGDYLLAHGGVAKLGAPTVDQGAVTDPNGNGIAQTFTGGIVHSSAKGTFLVPAASMPAYSSAGWLRGSFGWPTSDRECGVKGCLQTFSGGMISSTLAGVAAPMRADIFQYYKNAGGKTGPLGYPAAQSALITDKKNGNGAYQAFDAGAVHASANGVFLVKTTTMPAYSAAGWLRGRLGWPTSEEVCDANGCLQSFRGGQIRIPLTGAPFAVEPVTDVRIAAMYTSSGGPTGPLGYAGPITKVTEKRNGNGVVQRFEGGLVHSSVAGAFLVPAEVMTAYSAQRWVRGPLGWPKAAAVCDAGGCVQQFQHGTIDTH
jgi:hypothetical protein